MNFKHLTISRIVTNELLKLLSENIIGTPGRSMLYQHQDVKRKVFSIQDPYFVNLIKRNVIIGSCSFCYRKTVNFHNLYPSFYIRYFTFKSTYRKKFHPNIKQNSRSSEIKTEIRNLLEGSGLVDVSSKFFHYAYVDKDNARSAFLSHDFGFQAIREFNTIIFNRFFPKEQDNIHKISSEDILEIKNLLKSFYEDYNMFTFENFKEEFYYIIKDSDGNIVAGLQANPQTWKILEIPGFIGKILLNIFPQLPLFDRVINKNYTFLSFEFIYFKPGNEHKLELLLENLLAHNKVYSALTFVDNQTRLYKALKSLDLGIIHKLNKEVNAQVIAKFVNFDDTEIRAFQEIPAYISATDST